jgi:hypothetical protein
MVLWLGGLIVIQVLFVREGGFGQFPKIVEHLILGLFWLGGVGAGAFFFRKPVIVLIGRDGELCVRKIWLWRRATVWRGPAADLTALEVRETRDSEGDPYFELTLSAPGANDVVLVEGHDRTALMAAQARISAQIAAV